MIILIGVLMMILGALAHNYDKDNFYGSTPVIRILVYGGSATISIGAIYYLIR